MRTERVLLPVVAAVLAGACACGGASGPRGSGVVRERRMMMGTWFEIQIAGADEKAARAAAGAAFDEVDRVEALLSEWRETSEISAVNRAAGGAAVAVGPELLEVVLRAAEVSELTDGAFDITFAACGHLWSFAPPRIPADGELRECLRFVGYRRIEIDRERSTLRLPEAGMKIGIAGIGQGYGVDRAVAVLERHGITNYVVDGGGDLRVSGSRGGRPWTVGIAHPRVSGSLIGRIEAESGAVVTSGDYMAYFERDGVRYHHILDPTTGAPARRTAAVTVIAPDTTLADGLSTGLFVLGPERGLALVERLDGVEALFLDERAEPRASRGFPAWR